MGYSNFKNLKQVVKQFGIKVETTQLFSETHPIAPSDWLTTSIEIAYLNPLSNEKVKSERLISPILSEVHRLHKDKLTLFSGEELSVDTEQDLTETCDFSFSVNPTAYLLEAPIVVILAQAKNESMNHGITQSAAQVIGAQLFNQQEEKEIPIIWGCATTAGEWKFLKLEDQNLYVDINTYYVNKLDELLGVFHKIFEGL